MDIPFLSDTRLYELTWRDDAGRLCCTNRVYRLLGDRFVTNEPEDAEATREAVPYEERESV